MGERRNEKSYIVEYCKSNHCIGGTRIRKQHFAAEREGRFVMSLTKLFQGGGEGEGCNIC